jgi:transmembrane sensor
MSPWASTRWAAGGLAAVVIASVGYVAADRWPQPVTIETKPGVTRTIALADGSSVALNGATRVILDRKDARVATLEHGEVLVSVRHDAARPFRVTVGDTKIVDVGTQFSVTRDDGVTRVAVSEGEIAFEPDGADVRLRPGQALTSIDASHEVVVTRVAQTSVGAWRRNQLVYDGTPLRLVAADLSRRLGMQIVAAPDVAARPFRGTIATAGLSGSPETLAPLLDVTLRRSGTVWTMTGRQ